MDIVSLIISLISGALGGNIAGSVLKDQSLGPLGPRSSLPDYVAPLYIGLHNIFFQIV
jgi:hypothetical protein